MKHIIVDLEMNGVAKEYDNDELKGTTHKEIIEIGAVMLDEEYREIDSFMTYVKPQLNDVVEYRYTQLTGITTAMVKDAPVFADAIKAFADWCASCNDEFKLYQWSENDRTQIVSEMKMKEHLPKGNEVRLTKEWIDFQKEFSTLLGSSKAIALEKAMDYAGENFKGRQHDAMSDARNTAELFIMSRDKEKFKEDLKYIIEAISAEEAEEEASAAIGELIDFGSIKDMIGDDE